MIFEFVRITKFDSANKIHFIKTAEINLHKLDLA